MKLRSYILFIILIGLQSGLFAQNIDGLWKDTYNCPMTSYFYFDSVASTFKSYYHDDLQGLFGKGTFKYKGNKIFLEFDSIKCDIPIIELYDAKKEIDSIYIALFQYWGFPKRIDILKDGKRIYRNWTSTSTLYLIIEDYLYIKIPQKLDNIEIVFFDQIGSVDKEIARFPLKLSNKPYCNLYFYPCDSWYKYEDFRKATIKIRWLNKDFFETKGKSKYGFKRIIKNDAQQTN